MTIEKMLENPTLKGLIALYDYEVIEIKGDKVLLHDNQLDEEMIFHRNYLVEHFAMDCDYRYSIDGNEFHLNQAKELRSLL